MSNTRPCFRIAALKYAPETSGLILLLKIIHLSALYAGRTGHSYNFCSCTFSPLGPSFSSLSHWSISTLLRSALSLKGCTDYTTKKMSVCSSGRRKSCIARSRALFSPPSSYNQHGGPSVPSIFQCTSLVSNPSPSKVVASHYLRMIMHLIHREHYDMMPM